MGSNPSGATKFYNEDKEQNMLSISNEFKVELINSEITQEKNAGTILYTIMNKFGWSEETLAKKMGYGSMSGFKAVLTGKNGLSRKRINILLDRSIIDIKCEGTQSCLVILEPRVTSTEDLDKLTRVSTECMPREERITLIKYNMGKYPAKFQGIAIDMGRAENWDKKSMDMIQEFRELNT